MDKVINSLIAVKVLKLGLFDNILSILFIYLITKIAISIPEKSSVEITRKSKAS